MKNNKSYQVKDNKGLFVTFEGGEGSGKSTQIEFLKKYLLNNDYNVISTREPGGTPEGEVLRKTLVSGDSHSWDPLSEALIFNGLRRQHINKIISPSLIDRNIVLCDRFIDSTFVYQGFAGSINQSLLIELHKKFCYDLYPDLTFFFDLDPKLGLQRTKKRSINIKEDRFEKFGIDYHLKILKGYHQLTYNYKDRFVKIDGSQSIEKISKDIIFYLNMKLNQNA